MIALLACVQPAVVPPTITHSADSPNDSPNDSDSVVDTAPPLVADLLFDGTLTPTPLIGFGAQVWAGDSAWPTALDPLQASVVRVALNANLGSDAVDLPTDITAAEWDAWMLANVLNEAPTFVTDLQATLALTEARDITWIAHLWEAPPAWETSAGVLRSEFVDDQAALTAAMLGYLDTQGLRPRYLELSNEPDGDWNSNITPSDYNDLVIATRAALDLRGLSDIGLVGPGLAVLGGWTDPPAWVPSLSDEAVNALDAWSVHTWDDYAENGEGHAFLEARWAIFTSQTEARDPTKPILVTEMGSKDTLFGAAQYTTPDPSVCGASSESDGYAIRMLAHTVVALSYGADGISWWEAADQSWACSRWGMLDATGQTRRFADAIAMFTSAVPTDGGVVLPAEAPPPAVAVLGADQGAVLIVNDSAARVSHSVGVSGGWRLVEARGFATADGVLRDQLVDVGQATADATLGIDTANRSFFSEDADRLFRTADTDMSAVWSPGGDITAAQIVSWSWTGADPTVVTLDGSVDGATWTPLTATETITTPGWNRHLLEVAAVPAGTRHLRVTLPNNAAPAWSPQLGDVTIRHLLDAPGVLPVGDAPWTVDLPPGSAVVLVMER